ncbi:hypothetical protein STCU_02603 [Strigomonas culicis]|uniref:Uncharacterized protein n=1 Tax=Strigomonas culicis TaxID=28005 RepID=S9VXS1_9TRYP|nr:hypothetical protein STCU_05130 [Strigomonas culicis]EPY32866.1 hypothetical protein STCU_02603 [Strigomonas culicis]|eukprot:EPY28440.1 hypothetical protein STCU_05130 [Strigomonas culicis]
MSSEWGAMVFPGVYMIQKAKTSDALDEIVKDDGSLNYELIYLEIEELSVHIEKLKASNIEIEKYISQQGNVLHSREDEEENCMSGLAHEGHMDGSSTYDDSDHSDDEERESNADEDKKEEDLEIFREALLENENTIYRKEKELELLMKLVKDQKCGCSFHAHGQHATHPAIENTITEEGSSSAPVTDPIPHDRITL